MESKKVAENTTSNILKLHHERERASIEQYVYRNMMEREAGGFQRRMQGLEVEVKRLEVAECEMQKKYGDLLHERKLLAVRGQKKKIDEIKNRRKYFRMDNQDASGRWLQ